MLYSQLFGKTSKTVSRQASIVSHRLLLQAGFIRQLSAGRYTLLPLGLRVCQKIENIIRSEVEKTGAQELIVPTLHPIELWQQANRDKKFGDAMMRVTDRNGAKFTLSATAEVIMLDLVKKFSPSYKDLPINIYQFSQKFRDEARPSGGLLRTREFVMKDAYSFHANQKDLQVTYKKYWQAYENIATKLDLKVIAVESDNGAIGGSISHEFMVESEVGEDIIVKCSCGYAANLEAARFVKGDKNSSEKELALKEVEAVRGNTMKDGVKFHQLPLWQQIKDVLYFTDKKQFVLALIRGDYMVNETKLKNLIGANELRHAENQEIRKLCRSEPGFISPVGIKDNLAPGIKLTIVADDSLLTIKNMYGGANKKHRDLLNININRDYQADLIGDIARAQENFVCAKCKKAKLKFSPTIEFGNIFNIGYTYSQPMDGNFIAKDGSTKKLYMGSYGIGIGRTMAIIVQMHHDRQGIIWPSSVSPYQVHLIGLDLFKTKVKKQAEDLYHQLQKQKIEILYDDRTDVSAGAKFADADLIGIPVRLVVSQRSQAQNGVELKHRQSDKTEIVSIGQIITKIK